MRQVKAAERTLFHHFGDEGVLLNLSTETYYRLGGSGVAMWLALTENDAIEKARDVLLNQFDVSAEQLTADLDGLVQQLLHLGLITVHET